MPYIQNTMLMLVMAASVTGCVTTQPDAPERRAALEARFTTKTDVYPDQGAFTAPPKWKVGQFVVTGSTEKGRRQAIMRMAIVGEERGGYIIEMMNEDIRGKAGQQILIKGLDQIASGQASADDMEILWMRVMDDKGVVRKIDGQMLALMAMPMRTTFRQMFSTQSAQESSPGGTIQVPAGTFNGTVKTDSEVRTMGMSFKSATHNHPAVPINGMVRSETSDGKTVTELIEFGMSGARATF